MAARLIESLATTDAFAELFSDASVLQAMLDFEVGLARAQARVGIVPQAAAEAIAAAAKPKGSMPAQLARDGLRAGALPIPLVKALTERVRATIRPLRASFTGARPVRTSPIRRWFCCSSAHNRFWNPISRAWKARCATWRRLTPSTVMLGRTLLQAAPPTTFGLKAAGWLGSIRRGRVRLSSAFREALVVQFGGATGTLASLGERGIAVGRALAEELQTRVSRRALAHSS